MADSRFHIFPWREQESLLTGEVILRPTLDVLVSVDESFEIATNALIDTGAPRTVMPRGIADALDLECPDRGDVTIELMGRKWPAMTRTISLRLPPFDDLSWEAEVDFVLDEGLRFALLGYEGFLNRWAVSFNGYDAYFVVEPVESFESRIPPDPFDELQRRFPDPSG